MIAAVLALAASAPQEPAPFQGEAVLDRLLSKAKAERWMEHPIGDVMGKAGNELLATPYVGFTAERWVDREVCSIDLNGLDCVTFYENCLAFARMLKKGGSTPKAMMDEVRFTRYRDGVLTDYASRVHYTSDWIFDNARKGSVLNITPSLPGAARFEQKVGFMTANPTFYKQLVRYPQLRKVITAQEEEINARETYYVPVSALDRVEPLLRTGDILGFTTSKKGLDTSHTGMVFVSPGGAVGVLHASSSKKAVVHEEDLSEFVKTFATGIMVARPIEPK